MTLAVASALGAAAPLAFRGFDAGRVVAEALRELGLRAGRGQAVGPALLLERGEVRERVEARAEAFSLGGRRASLFGTALLDVWVGGRVARRELSVVFGLKVNTGQNK